MGSDWPVGSDDINSVRRNLCIKFAVAAAFNIAIQRVATAKSAKNNLNIAGIQR